MKGQKMLKVCSILMIVGGGIAAVLSVLAILGAAALATAGALETFLLIAVVLAVLGAGIELAAGIVGVKAAGMPSVGKIKASVIMGILVVVMSIASNVFNYSLTGKFDVVSIVLGLVLPVLYLIGVFKFKNALVALLSGE